MGALLERVLTRLVEFPIKDKPICFHLQKSFKSTGEEKPELKQTQTDAYDELQNAFIKRLTEVGEGNREWFGKNFLHWDQMTIDNLNNIFILLASEENGMIDLKRFGWFLNNIGDRSSSLYRKQRFQEVDSNLDGYINFDQFLFLVYNYEDFDETEGLEGVAKICYEQAEQIRSVTYLSVGEQLQHGLF